MSLPVVTDFGSYVKNNHLVSMSKSAKPAKVQISFCFSVNASNEPVETDVDVREHVFHAQQRTSVLDNINYV